MRARRRNISIMHDSLMLNYNTSGIIDLSNEPTTNPATRPSRHAPFSGTANRIAIGPLFYK